MRQRKDLMELCWENYNLKDLAAIRKDTGLYCGSRLRKGEVFAYVGLSQNLKDLKDLGSQLVPGGMSMAGALMLQLRDTISLIKADLDLVCVQRA
jgi:hypothetical protein